MTALDNLRAVARGDRPDDDGLLGVTRCAWGWTEVIGEEAILAAFSERPFEPDGVLAIETAHGAALIGEDDALVADIYSGRIGRLWRVGSGITLPNEPRVDVAFDPDMHQVRGGLYVRAEDHPELSEAEAERVRLAAIASLEGQRAGKLRVRGFVVRAFASQEGSAALMAVHILGNKAQRSAGFSYSIIGLPAGGDTVLSVGGASLTCEWTPRI